MKTVRALADLTRVFPNQLMIGAGVLIGEVVALSSLPPLRQAVLGFVGPAVLGASTFAMNDYYDLESDRRGGRRDRPLVRGDISPRTARNVFLIGFPTGLILSSIINLGCLVIAVVFAAVSWGFGSIIVNRRPIALDPIVISGWQQLVGGVGFTIVALLVREPAPRPTPEAWAAWAYLVVFGSLLAYTSFVYALKLLPTTVVMTYAYVNPVIAVFLGWLILSEGITVYTLTGAAFVVASVVGIFRNRR